MALFSKKKKQEKYESEMILRLHAGLAAANKENTVLYKQIRILSKQVEGAYSKLCEISIDRDMWFENYMTLVKKYKELENEQPLSKTPGKD